jgi:hypothetical protein
MNHAARMRSIRDSGICHGYRTVGHRRNVGYERQSGWLRTVAEVEENAGAMKFGPLTAEQMHQIACCWAAPRV